MADSKYLQVEQYIRKKIEKGSLKIGDQIPTEEQLCQRFGFSRMTVNKALNRLCEQGYIERTKGKGSFVSSPHVSKIIETSSSFTEDMANIGMVAGSKLISYEVKPAKDYPDIKKKLKLHDDDFIHYFVRLRTGNDIPVAISYTYVSAKIVPAIEIKYLNSSFYKYLDEINLKRVINSMTFSATLPTEEQKKLLKADNIALFISSHVTYTIKDKGFIPFEYVETHYNSELYNYSTKPKIIFDEQ